MRMFSSGILRLATVMLLGAMAVHGGGIALDIVDAFKQSPVEQAAIAVSTLEVCPHHPQGCPKSCLCPKTHLRVEKGGTTPARPSTLNEPSWVTCNEGNPANAPQFFGLFLGEACLEVGLPVSAPLILSIEESTIPSAFHDPLLKVPIG